MRLTAPTSHPTPPRSHWASAPGSPFLLSPTGAHRGCCCNWGFRYTGLYPDLPWKTFPPLPSVTEHGLTLSSRSAPTRPTSPHAAEPAYVEPRSSEAGPSRCLIKASHCPQALALWAWVWWEREGLGDAGLSSQGFECSLFTPTVYPIVRSCDAHSRGACALTAHLNLGKRGLTWCPSPTRGSCKEETRQMQGRRRGSWVIWAGRWCEIAPLLSMPIGDMGSPACAIAPDGLGVTEVCGRRNNDSPKEVHVLITRTCESVTFHDRRAFAGLS